MTYHHIIRVQRKSGAVQYIRSTDNFVNADYWENYYWDSYKRDTDEPYSIVCVNVFKENNDG